MRRRKRLIAVVISLSAMLSTGLPAGAAGTGKFEIGGYWQPPIRIPIDYNNNTNWANIAANGIDFINQMRLNPGDVVNKADNETGLAYSTANNVKLLLTDSSISDKMTYTAADYTALQNALIPYLGDTRVKG
ncbi:hypothetical protein [Paenibacillus nasutitermitis]|uniref:Uncharacterized protein n=1 Tax=Paenibacillus nasutitermitis TaxID=1652958 RepID=A0A916Z9Y5_9BACL|nr:hypothetical protein [Paenibacillus nasutitermitis]GGD81957.1 hypothetical protein GCM10010911_45090 [Paenibacillus nasutitermitis]